MNNYAERVLTTELDRLKQSIQSLEDDFCRVPTYEDFKKGIKAMTPDEYQKKLKDLLEKRDDIEHSISICRFHSGWRK